MEPESVGNFKIQVHVNGNMTVISGDILFHGRNYIVELHNNEKRFIYDDYDRAILEAIASFMEIKI